MEQDEMMVYYIENHNNGREKQLDGELPKLQTEVFGCVREVG